MQNISTLGELKKAGYQSLSIAEELRKNLSAKLRNGEKVFTNIIGYDDTVLPELEQAILAGHSINFLGLRGQGKTKMARLLVQLLDEYIPVVKGSPLNECPFNPILPNTKLLVQNMGDNLPIAWLHREERYTEKLATLDVNIADLIGDIDPIKAANLKLSLDNEEVIHYGIIPRSHRGIFVINELPDLQPRIQVALFNLLQEGDLQIRGYKLRIPVDIQFVFTSNPEDYTNRGSIITPLKDRIQSQIFTHYPLTNELGRAITKQEIKRFKNQENIEIPYLIEVLLEQIAIEARKSEYVDVKSGVSARLSITTYENVLSAVERRMLINGLSSDFARVSDIYAAIPAIIGKIEMVYEGEQEGAVNVAKILIDEAIKSVALHFYPEMENLGLKKSVAQLKSNFTEILTWFEEGNSIDIPNSATPQVIQQSLTKIPTLQDKANQLDAKSSLLMMEFILHWLSTFNLIQKNALNKSTSFKDTLGSIMRDFN
jgi:magnesium chelatase subunit I